MARMSIFAICLQHILFKSFRWHYHHYIQSHSCIRIHSSIMWFVWKIFRMENQNGINSIHTYMCLICVRGKMTQLPSVVASFACCERHILRYFFLFFVPLVSRSLTNCHAISHQLFTHTNCNQLVVHISVASRGNFTRPPLVAHYRQQPSANMNNSSYSHARMVTHRLY